MSELVELEIRDAVGTITLNRPEKLNAINDAMLKGLRRAISTIGGDPTIGAAVLHGRGRAFSAGADITAMSSMDEPSFARTIGLFMEVAKEFRACPKPIVAAIHGHALAAGFELACICDIRIASEDARLGLPDAPIGLSPTSGMTYLLPRIVGLGRSIDLTFSAEPIDAREALRIGLVTRVVEPATLLDVAHALAARIASFPMVAVSRSKREFYGALETSFAEATTVEHEGEVACFRDPATRERFREFVNRKRR
jgi:enoyl-CoA hydratase